MSMSVAPDPAVVLEAPPLLDGDARLTFTGPVVCGNDPVRRACEPWQLDDELDAVHGRAGVDLEAPRLDHILRGTLTFGAPDVRHLLGALTLHARDRAAVGEALGPAVDECEIGGLVFDDGIVTVAVVCTIEDGWGARRDQLHGGFGPGGRDEAASALRDVLLPVVTRLIHHLDGDAEADVDLPYLNLTYAGATTSQEAGRRPLGDDVRALVYPDSAGRLLSRSPRVEEYFFAGFAYSVLMEPVGSTETAEKVRLLLLVLGYQYARLLRGIVFAEDRLDAVRQGDRPFDEDSLDLLELVLSTEYRELVAPTFSFDHHTLVLRDAYLATWKVDKVFERCRFVLAGMHDVEQRRLAEEQSRRMHRLDLIVFVLTVVSVVSSIEAVMTIADRL